MKKVLLVGAVLGVAGAALGDDVNFAPGLENWGANDPDASGNATATVIWTDTFDLPGVVSLDGATFELNHSFLSDLHITITSPDGDEFLLARGRSSQNVAPFNAAFDGSDLGNGGSTLSGATNYNFAPTGLVWNDALNLPNPAANGTFAALSWHDGPFSPGTWTVTLWDAWDTVDDGALGDVQINYTIPGPGVVALAGVAGCFGRRRRG